MKRIRTLIFTYGLLVSSSLCGMQEVAIEIQETPNAILHHDLVNALNSRSKPFPPEVNNLIAHYALFKEEEEKAITAGIVARRETVQRFDADLERRHCTPIRRNIETVASIIATMGGLTLIAYLKFSLGHD